MNNVIDIFGEDFERLASAASKFETREELEFSVEQLNETLAFDPKLVGVKRDLVKEHLRIVNRALQLKKE